MKVINMNVQSRCFFLLFETHDTRMTGSHAGCQDRAKNGFPFLPEHTDSCTLPAASQPPHFSHFSLVHISVIGVIE